MRNVPQIICPCSVQLIGYAAMRRWHSRARAFKNKRAEPVPIAAKAHRFQSFELPVGALLSVHKGQSRRRTVGGATSEPGGGCRGKRAPWAPLEKAAQVRRV